MKVYATAAALTTLCTSRSLCNAFTLQSSHLQSPVRDTDAGQMMRYPRQHQQMPVLPSSHRHQNKSARMFFSRKNRSTEEEENSSFLKKAANKIKGVVPSFLKPKSSLTKREKAKNEVSSSIDTMLKDAPLGVRMMGKMISPILSSVAGNIAEAMEEQSKQMSDLLSDARMYIVSDNNAIQELGEPIEVGSPFSQSSSSISVNGQTKSSINASFEVRGSRGSGIASMDATDGKISQLLLNINGRRFPVSVTGMPQQTVSGSASKQSRGRAGKKRDIKDAEIIDAEFVEKKFDK